MLSFANKEDLDQFEITSITDEIIGTSQIEGEYLRRESVKDSVANAINNEYTSTKDTSTRHTDNLAELTLDSFRNNEPLSLERLPYNDGNGRISRAIADYILSRDTQDEYKIYVMADAIF